MTVAIYESVQCNLLSSLYTPVLSNLYLDGKYVVLDVQQNNIMGDDTAWETTLIQNANARESYTWDAFALKFLRRRLIRYYKSNLIERENSINKMIANCR